MANCAICGKTPKNISGLAGHVQFKHKLGYDDYKAGRYQQQNIQPLLPSVQQTALPPQQQSVVTGLSESDWESIADRLYQKLQGNTVEELPQGATVVPGLEEVEVTVEKVNYRVSLSPDIFWRWNMFKAQNQRLHSMGQAELFQGDFRDFLDLATKTLLSRYGLHPVVMTTNQGD